jgi:hypothetical protein
MSWRPALIGRRSRWIANAVVWTALTLSVGGCVTVAHGLIGRDGADTARRVLGAVPNGTLEAEARRTMETNGYKCRAEDNAWYSDSLSKTPAQGRILSCISTPGVSARGGYFFSDEYQVSFLVRNGRAQLIVAVVNATGS